MWFMVPPPWRWRPRAGGWRARPGLCGQGGELDGAIATDGIEEVEQVGVAVLVAEFDAIADVARALKVIASVEAGAGVGGMPGLEGLGDLRKRL
jgi:hypothetical protein